MNGLSHLYHLDESTFILRDIRSNFSFLLHFSMKFVSANRIAPDAVSHLGLFRLPMSHKTDSRLVWVNMHSLLQFDVYSSETLHVF